MSFEWMNKDPTQCPSRMSASVSYEVETDREKILESEKADQESESGESNDDQKVVNETASKVPSDLKVEDQVFDIAFHPSKNVITCGEITGKVSVFSYSTDANKKLCTFNHHKRACRCLSFSSDGDRLFTCSKDKSIQVIDLNSGSIIHNISKAHEEALNSMKVISQNYIATGSDNGSIKVWDTRTFTTIAEFSDRKDYISDMTCDKEKKHLLCTSGDGVLSVYNLRKKELEQTSDQLDEELLSVAIVKNGQKVVCGSADGVLNIYSWGEWGDISDRIPTNNDSIDAICPITEDIVCTGTDDGYIRSLFILPHRAIGAIGKHGTFGIENLRLSQDDQLLASCSSENTVKFWDVSSLHKEDIDPVKQKKHNRKRKMADQSTSKNDFFADL